MNVALWSKILKNIYRKDFAPVTRPVGCLLLCAIPSGKPFQARWVREVVVILNLQYLFLRPLSRTTHRLFLSFTYNDAKWWGNENWRFTIEILAMSQIINIQSVTLLHFGCPSEYTLVYINPCLRAISSLFQYSQIGRHWLRVYFLKQFLWT